MPLVNLEDKPHKEIAQIALDSVPKRTIKSVVNEAVSNSIPEMRKRLEATLRKGKKK